MTADNNFCGSILARGASMGVCTIAWTPMAMSFAVRCKRAAAAGQYKTPENECEHSRCPLELPRGPTAVVVASIVALTFRTRAFW